MSYLSHIRHSLLPSTINQRIRSFQRYFDDLLETEQIKYHAVRIVQESLRQVEKLFTCVIRNELHKILKVLQHQFSYLKNIQQIRASVIHNWLKNYNLREVQYMCGHWYISSTEAYCLINIEELKTGIEQSHPFG